LQVNGTPQNVFPLMIDNLSIECITAVNVSVKDQLTLSISVAIGSALVRHFMQ